MAVFGYIKWSSFDKDVFYKIPSKWLCFVCWRKSGGGHMDEGILVASEHEKIGREREKESEGSKGNRLCEGRN